MKLRLASFATKAPNAGAANAPNVYGKEAIVQIFTEAAALVAAKNPEFTFKTLTPLQVFRWLLTTEQASTVKQWTDDQFAKIALVANRAAKAKAGARKRADGDALAKLATLLKA